MSTYGKKIIGNYGLCQQIIESLVSEGYPDESFYTDFDIEGVEYNLVIIDPDTKNLLAIYEFDITSPVVVTSEGIRRIINKYASLVSNPKIHLYIAHAIEGGDSFSISKILYQTKSSNFPLHVKQKEIVNFDTLRKAVLETKQISNNMKDPVSKLRIKINEIEKLKKSTSWGAEYKLWDESVKKLVKDIFGQTGLDLFEKQQTVIVSDEGYRSELKERKLLLEGMINNIDDYSQATLVVEGGKEDPSLFHAEQPGWIGNIVWYIKFPSRFLSGYIKNSFLRNMLSFFLLVIIFLVISKAYFNMRGIDQFIYQLDTLSYSQKSPEEKYIYDVYFKARIHNYSDKSAYLKELEYVVWKNRVLNNSYLYDFSKNNEIRVLSSASTTISGPIYFGPDEVKDVEWRFTLDLRERQSLHPLFANYDCVGVFCSYLNPIEILTADNRNNVFDKTGSLVSQDLMDQWFLFPNNTSRLNKATAYMRIILELIFSKVKNFVLI